MGTKAFHSGAGGRALRSTAILAAPAAVLVGPAAAAVAQAEEVSRGPGLYLSLTKVGLIIVLFLLWVATTDWVNRDLQDLKIKHTRWNPLMVASFPVAFLLLLLIPFFLVGFALLLIAYFVPLILYVVHRNGRVDDQRKILTRQHLRFLAANLINRLGGKMEVDEKAEWEKGPPLILNPTGGPTHQDEQARVIMARQMPGFLFARQILAESLARRSSALMLDYNQQAVGVRLMIDGVWHNDQPRERQTGDPLLEALKVLCGLNPQDRQRRQEGPFAVVYEDRTKKATLVTQGTKTGERAVIQFADSKVEFQSLADLGMRPKLEEQLIDLLHRPQGYVFLAAPPANGLRTTTNVALNKMDRFTREFASIEEENNRYEEVENILVTVYQSSEGHTPVDVLPRVIRMQPHVIVVRDVVNAETVRFLCGEVEDGHLILSTVRAKDAIDGLMRVLALSVPPADLAPALLGVLAQRLIRKLCDACKEAYQPPPQILKQLGATPQQIPALYRPPQQPEEVCAKCQGIGYYGRTALFELLVVGDHFRRALAAGAPAEMLRKAARQDGMRFFQEEGILLAAKGVTSLPELARVLKEG